MRVFLRITFVLATLITLWHGMMLTHEAGHLLAALLTRAHIDRFMFPLIGFSRTEISDNPHPLFVAWAGPVFGTSFPLITKLVLHRLKIRLYLLDLFAGFCLVANGAYIALGSFDNIGDAGDMLRHGSPRYALWLFGVAAVSLGLVIWHRLGPGLGLRTHWHTRDGGFALAGAALLLGICALAR